MKLKEKTTGKLENELKSLKISTGILIGVLSALFIVSLFRLLTKDNSSVFSSMIIVPIALSAILPSQFRNIKNLKAELESRK